MYIVTGMHRSGTSMVSNLLAEIGADLGPKGDLLGANQWNVNGYFENKYVVDINNKLIVGAQATIEDWIAFNERRDWFRGLRWSSSKIFYLVLPDRDTILKRAKRMKNEIERMASLSPDFVAKDTRFSMTIAAWQYYGKVDRILYIYRHPVEVARSLKKREKTPLWFGYRLWLQHVKSFFQQVDFSKVVFVKYNALLDNNSRLSEMKRLYGFLRREWNQEQAAGIFEQTINRDLKHHTRDGKAMPVMVQRWYEFLEEKHG